MEGANMTEIRAAASCSWSRHPRSRTKNHLPAPQPQLLCDTDCPDRVATGRCVSGVVFIVTLRVSQKTLIVGLREVDVSRARLHEHSIDYDGRAREQVLGQARLLKEHRRCKA